MLHHFHDLDVDADCRTAPAWYYEAAEILLVDYEGEALLILYTSSAGTMLSMMVMTRSLMSP